MADVAGRTIREFPADQSAWGVIDDWARRVGYELKEAGDFGRLYQKGSGLLTLPRMLAVVPTATGIRLEAWVSASGINRLFSLFIVPPESVLESGGEGGYHSPQQGPRGGEPPVAEPGPAPYTLDPPWFPRVSAR